MKSLAKASHVNTAHQVIHHMYDGMSVYEGCSLSVWCAEASHPILTLAL